MGCLIAISDGALIKGAATLVCCLFVAVICFELMIDKAYREAYFAIPNLVDGEQLTAEEIYERLAADKIVTDKALVYDVISDLVDDGTLRLIVATRAYNGERVRYMLISSSRYKTAQ